MSYQFADGHDQSGSLAIVDPQPKSDGISFPETIYAGGAVYDNGFAYFYWEWSVLTRDQFGALMTTFGLSYAVNAPVKSNACTVQTSLGGDKSTFDILNATVHRPEHPKGEFKLYRNVKILFSYAVEA